MEKQTKLQKVSLFFLSPLSSAMKWALLSSLILAAIFAVVSFALTFSPYGTAPMFMMGGIFIAVILVFFLVATLLLNIFRRIYWQTVLVILISILLLATTMLLAIYLIPLMILSIICVYFAVMFATGQYKPLGKIKKVLRGGALVLSGAGIVLLAVLIFWPGPGLGYDDRPDVAMLALPHPTAMQNIVLLANPSLPGSYSHTVHFYASPTQRNNPFPGEVVIPSGTADASEFLNGWSGTRRRQLGFEPDTLPLNAQVWMPEGDGPFPIALIVHGNHTAGNRSDLGYDYLGEFLASRGIIAASVDQNFLNGSAFFDMVFSSPLQRENGVRGFVLLEHLRQWYEWNADPTHIFYGRVDFQRTALIGHSRGGEAAALAAAFAQLRYYPGNGNVVFDYPFQINTVIAFAPTHRQYNPAGLEVTLSGVNYLVIHGGHDKDVSSFMGAGMYNQVDVTEYGIKARVWMHHANHGQFNSVWGGRDFPRPMHLVTHRRLIMPMYQQQQAAKVFIGAFLEATFHGRHEYTALFRDFSHGAEWLPPALYVTAFADSSMFLLDSFDKGFDLTVSSSGLVTYSAQGFERWTRSTLPKNFGANTNRGLMLQWGGGENGEIPIFTAEFAPGAVSVGDTLYMSLSSDNVSASNPNVYFEIRLTDNNGTTATMHINHFGGVTNPIDVNIFTPIMSAISSTREPVLQMISVPTEFFTGLSGGIVSMEWIMETSEHRQTLFVDDLRVAR